jgi:hypothetical protein
MKQYFIFFLLITACCLSFTACKKSAGEQNNVQADPIKTEKGIAVGTPASKTIGMAGGELASPDGKVKMIIPQGAVTTNTQFSIQPITNTLYDEDASRLAYRLLPEGTTFAKPVQLIFKYDSQDLKNTAEDLMTIAWQQANGTWKVEPTRLNKQTKALMVETTHFSDWTKTGGFELKIEKEVLKPNEKSKLWVVSAMDDDLLAPLGLLDEDVASLTALGNWKIIEGNGSLNAIKSGPKGFAYSAIYTAPASVNTILSVVITMEVEGFNKIKDPSAPGGFRQTGKMILFGRLLVSDNFMIGTLGGEQFGFFGNDVAAIGMNGTMVFRGSDASGEVTLSVNATGVGSYPCGQIIQPGKGGVMILSPSGPNYTYSYFECGQTGELKFSPSAVQITKWPAVGQPAEGNFSGLIYLSDGACGARQKWLEVKFSIVRGG